jgi:shikimate kinase
MQNIVLVGPMGAGKSTVGRGLALLLRRGHSGDSNLIVRGIGYSGDSNLILGSEMTAESIG